MINYKKGKVCYKINFLGSLYVDKAKLNDNEPPIIYIGGQMDHRGHILEQTGYTLDLNHNMFTGSWMYDYSVLTKYKNMIDAEAFSLNLMAALKEANLGGVTLVTQSHGGMIGSYASKSDRIDRVIAIHSPVLGTPLASPEYISKYKNLLSKSQKLMLLALKKIIDERYGFQQDNFKGLDLKKVDLNKLLVVGSYIDPETESNRLLKETFKLIQMTTTYRSDGIVPFDISEFEGLGINHMITPSHTNHFESCNTEYIEEIVEKTLEIKKKIN